MFTGIVGEVGQVVECRKTNRGKRLSIVASRTIEELTVGGSVAVNGICLTAVRIEPPRFEVEAMAETLTRSNLDGLSQGSSVNLERPLPIGGRLDGHIVQGHVDAVGVVTEISREGRSKRVTVTIPQDLRRYLVVKGSVAVDGVALTVASVDRGTFQIALIPHTLEVTTLGDMEVGHRANLEVDVIAKYVESLLVYRN